MAENITYCPYPIWSPNYVLFTEAINLEKEKEFRERHQIAQAVIDVNYELSHHYTDAALIIRPRNFGPFIWDKVFGIFAQAGWSIASRTTDQVEYIIAANTEHLEKALTKYKDTKPENGDNMITTLKGFTDKKLQRHYYPEHEEWEVSECSNQIKFDMAGQAEIFIDRDEAADLAKLFADFAKHGTFRVPRNQEPSKTSNGE